MTLFEFDAWIGDGRHRVWLSLYFKGKERNSYNLNINGFYVGMLAKNKGEWQWWPSRPERSFITADDIQILGEIIDEKME